MAWRVRTATADDLPAILTVTRRARSQLASLEPAYWRVADDADAAHQRRLGQLTSAEEAHVRVLVSDEPADHAVHGADGEAVVGCATTVRQVDHWLIDDLAAADDGWWGDGMIELLRAVRERPALTCVPRADVRMAACCASAGMRPRSAYWLLRLDGIEPPRSTAERLTAAAVDTSLPPAAPHSFGGPLDPTADGALVFGDAVGGICVLGPPAVAPPVYEPGGTTGLADRVTGKVPGPLVDAATRAAAERGDVQLLVVCADDAPRLQDALVDRAFRRVVDVYGWPGWRR